jgi:thioredoxin-related protein
LARLPTSVAVVKATIVGFNPEFVASETSFQRKESLFALHICQIFLCITYQNGGQYTEERHKMFIKYNKLPKTFPFQTFPKYIKIDIFGRKICHLATLLDKTNLHGLQPV